MFRRSKVKGVTLEFRGERYHITTGNDLTINLDLMKLNDVTEMKIELKVKVVGTF